MQLLSLLNQHRRISLDIVFKDIYILYLSSVWIPIGYKFGFDRVNIG